MVGTALSGEEVAADVAAGAGEDAAPPDAVLPPVAPPPVAPRNIITSTWKNCAWELGTKLIHASYVAFSLQQGTLSSSSLTYLA